MWKQCTASTDAECARSTSARLIERVSPMPARWARDGSSGDGNVWSALAKRTHRRALRSASRAFDYAQQCPAYICCSRGYRMRLCSHAVQTHTLTYTYEEMAGDDAATQRFIE